MFKAKYLLTSLWPKLHGRQMPLKDTLVFWLVLLLALHRDHSVPNAFVLLVEACRSLVGGLRRDAVTEIGDHLIAIQRARVDDLARLQRRLLRDLAGCRIDRPRRPRQWPRVVKVKISNLKVKKTHHRESKLTVNVERGRLESNAA